MTDFASYKPNYILQDTEQGLAEFRLFYGSSIDKCNLAPEKLTDKDTTPTSMLTSKALFNVINHNTSMNSSMTSMSGESSKFKKN